MAYIPSELVQMIVKDVSKKDLPNFRLANRVYRHIAQDSFANKCFEGLLTTLDTVALDHLFSAVNHEKYGPNIKSITFQMNGIDENFSQGRPRIVNILRALEARGQQVDIKVVVIAMALPQSYLHDYGMAALLECLMSNAHRLGVLSGPTKICIPSPVLDYSISPARRYLAVSLGRFSSRHETHITYTDAPGSIIYDPTTHKLTMTGLRVHHIHEFSSFFGQIDVRSLSIINSDVDIDCLHDLLRFHKVSLRALELRDISLYFRSHGGILDTASWVPILRVMARDLILNRLDLSNLQAGSVEVGWSGDVHVASVSTVGRLNALISIYNALRHLTVPLRYT